MLLLLSIEGGLPAIRYLRHLAARTLARACIHVHKKESYIYIRYNKSFRTIQSNIHPLCSRAFAADLLTGHPAFAPPFFFLRQDDEDFPANLGKFTNLRWLRLSKTGLSVVPGLVSRMRNLEHLSLDRNSARSFLIANIHTLHLAGYLFRFSRTLAQTIAVLFLFPSPSSPLFLLLHSSKR